MIPARLRHLIAAVPVVATIIGAITVAPTELAEAVPRMAEAVRTDLITSDVIYDATRDVLHASIHPFDTRYSNQLVTLDPRTGDVLSAHSLGSRPSQLALSEDAQAVYVGLDNGASVARVSLLDFEIEWSTTVGTDPLGTPFAVGDIAVMPGAPDTIAVARRWIGGSDGAGIVVIDSGVMRPILTTHSPDRSAFVTFGASSDVLYGQGQSGQFWRLTVDERGVEVSEWLAPAGGGPVAYREGMVYSRGDVIDVRTTTSAVVASGIGARDQVLHAESGLLYAFPDPVHRPDEVVVYDVDDRTIVNRARIPGHRNHARPVTAIERDRFAYLDTVPSGYGFLVLVDLTPERGSAGEYTALTPARILDTRTGLGRFGIVEPLIAGQTIAVDVAGVGGVPEAGVSAVVINLAAVDPTDAGFLTVFPTGTPRPSTSSLNFRSNTSVANLVTMPVGTGGAVSVFNPFGDVDLVIDVAGYYANIGGPSGARFRAIEPQRVMDTRVSASGSAEPIAADSLRPVELLGFAGIPPSGVRAVALNVTVTDASQPTFVTVFPGDGPRPLASNVNVIDVGAIANQAIVRMPDDGVLHVYNAAGTAHVVIDVVGYYEVRASPDEAGRFVTMTPFRAIDTRAPVEGVPPNLSSGTTIEWGDHEETASAYAINVTVTDTIGAGFVTAFPTGPGSQPPLASTVNYGPGETVPNHAIIATGPLLGFYGAGGHVHLIVDVFGYFT